MISEICLSYIIRHPEHNKIKIDMAESEEALEGLFQSFCSGNVERRFAKWQTHRSKTGARSCHKRLARRHDVLASHFSNTRRRLHGYRGYLCVA